jgi:hypothetical protein
MLHRRSRRDFVVNANRTAKIRWPIMSAVAKADGARRRGFLTDQVQRSSDSAEVNYASPDAISTEGA